MSASSAPAMASLAEVTRLAGRLDVPFPVRSLEIGAGVLDGLLLLIDALAGGRGPVSLLVDGVIHEGRDGPVKPAILGALGRRPGSVRDVVLRDGDGPLHATEERLDEATQRCADSSLLVSAGSGTVTDIGKVVAERLNVPHVVVQTAASVNGYTNDQSVVLVAGAKRTRPSRWPTAIVIDTDVVARAPAVMNRAGIGDLLSMFTAPADWLVASTIGFGRPYRAELVALVRPQGDLLLELAGRDAVSDDDLAALARLLALSGFSIGLAGSTAPASGLEHVISHLLEMHALAGGLEPSLHGLQAGLGAVVAAVVWQRLRAMTGGDPLPALDLPDHDIARERVRRAFTRLGPATEAECWDAYATKLVGLAERTDRLAQLRAGWPELQRHLDGVLAEPQRLAAALRQRGEVMNFAALPGRFDADVVRWAITNGHRMRDRVVVSDLVELLGWWTDDFVDAVLADLDELGVLH